MTEQTPEELAVWFELESEGHFTKQELLILAILRDTKTAARQDMYEALEAIAKRRGIYSLESLGHAEKTIKDMETLARNALALAEGKQPEDDDENKFPRLRSAGVRGAAIEGARKLTEVTNCPRCKGDQGRFDCPTCLGTGKQPEGVE